jgi:uncharacterized protein YaeQ
MALSATIYNFDINLSDVDRGVYETLSLRVAQHPTETHEYMLMRVLAYGLEFQEHIAFGQSIGTTGGDEPAVWAKDYAGQIKLWVEVGMPDADKLHRASKSAERVAIYTHRAPEMLLRNLAGKTIFRAAEIPLITFERTFLSQLVSQLERRMVFDMSITERQLYITIGNTHLETPIVERRLGEN